MATSQLLARALHCSLCVTFNLCVRIQELSGLLLDIVRRNTLVLDISSTFKLLLYLHQPLFWVLLALTLALALALSLGTSPSH